ncbi:hypothetical protein BDY24DRAFT_367887 [Mrakia frigida]|uniref:uncharacterized protein n=1 Tax=Mrakia frigida TaxID=29902 RepID=UPI003FCC14C2
MTSPLLVTHSPPPCLSLPSSFFFPPNPHHQSPLQPILLELPPMLTLKLATRTLAQRGSRAFATTMPGGGTNEAKSVASPPPQSHSFFHLCFYEKNAPLVWLGGAAAVGGLIYYSREDESAKKKTVAQAGGVEVKK